MTDVQRALLGDHEAAERLTARGELLPCPFCGGTEVYTKNELYGYQAICNDCLARSPLSENRNRAIVRWNTRAPILSAEEIKKLEEFYELV